MTNDEMFAAITVQRNRLLDVAEGFTEAEWNTPSLCDGWRVRDVLGHLLAVVDYPLGKFFVGVVTSFGFNAYTDRLARRYGERDPDDLLAGYRVLAAKKFAPPIVGPIAPLSDICTHARDIERPLARPSTLEPESVRATLDFAFTGPGRAVSGKRTKALRFVATDLDWSKGTGKTVEGPSEALMMALNGRKVALADLAGDGLAELTARG
ncbi:MAG: maleylpyruvate isomerase family mycothiol-dependent enzyme [Acidimicrobiia bacterium]